MPSMTDDRSSDGGLRPCPFCGGEANADGYIRFSKPLTDAWWADETEITEAFYVNCTRCGAVSRSGIVGGYQTRAEAVERWNTRTPPDQPDELAGREDFSRLTLQSNIEAILREYRDAHPHTLARKIMAAVPRYQSDASTIAGLREMLEWHRSRFLKLYEDATLGPGIRSYALTSIEREPEGRVGNEQGH